MELQKHVIDSHADVPQYTMNDLIKKLTNDTTGKLYCKPILGEDGQIHEELEYIKKHGHGVLNFTYIIPIISLIDYLIEQHPELEKNKYVADYSIMSGDFCYNFRNIIAAIDNKKWDYLLNFDSFYVEKLGESYIYKIINNKTESFKCNICPIEIQIHVLKNIKDINVNILDKSSVGMVGTKTNWPLLNRIITKTKKSDILMKVLKYCKDIDVNVRCPTDGWTTIHQLFHYKNDKNIVNAFMNKNKIDWLAQNKKGLTALEIGFKKGKFCLIELALTNYNFDDDDEIDKIIDNIIFKIFPQKLITCDQMEKITKLLSDKRFLLFKH
jgi:hypothetical protein